MIVVDSVASLLPLAMAEADYDQKTMGVHAKMMSEGLNKIKGIANKTKTTIIFINQIREKIGQMFGNPETTPGGRALKFYSSLRMSVKCGQKIKVEETKQVLGLKITVEVIKSKFSKSHQTCLLYLKLNEGFVATEEDIYKEV